ncbi:MAG TPA: N-acetylmuramoyl-L-alanine amidase-like domain-containing protein [Candidatus Binataceae bacterium]|nr:N-acetylmuramoyl-L-alanine amidase-like domain-containing protein [Candidatus Binataceae bacterium]
MNRAQPRGLNRRRVEYLLSRAQREPSLGSRIDVLSQQFLGRPYKSNPLIGSIDTDEVLVASLDAFDCVTYIETVLALARAHSVDDFVARLRKLRYDRGIVKWERRNHYMTDWISNNVRDGIVTRISVPHLPIRAKDRILTMIAGLPPRRARVRCVPKSAVRQVKLHLRDGDLLFFVSTRKNLDVFHAGIVVHDGDRIAMRHASRSKGGVVQQDLDEFLAQNRMAGVIVARPIDTVRRTGASRVRVAAAG